MQCAARLQGLGKGPSMKKSKWLCMLWVASLLCWSMWSDAKVQRSPGENQRAVRLGQISLSFYAVTGGGSVALRFCSSASLAA